jgi:hypothetical protein
LQVLTPPAAQKPRLSGCFDSLQGKKSTFSRFSEILCAKRNKLLEVRQTGETFCPVLASRPGRFNPHNREGFSLSCPGQAAWAGGHL